MSKLNEITAIESKQIFGSEVTIEDLIKELLEQRTILEDIFEKLEDLELTQKGNGFFDLFEVEKE